MNSPFQPPSRNEIYLSDFFIVKPAYSLPQEELIEWMTACHLAAEEKKDEQKDEQKEQKKKDQNTKGQENRQRLEKVLHHYAVKPSQISQRSFECPDAFSKDFSQAQIYRVTDQSYAGVDIKERTRFYSQKAIEVFRKIYFTPDKNQKKPDHLVHVTCTGYISPSAPQRVVAEPEWGNITGITHAYHMGCYAALPAVLLTQGMVALQSAHNPDFRADIVHTEMCSLHMNPSIQTPEQIVVQSLFADGHIKYSVTNQLQQNKRHLRIITIAEKIVPDSDEDMSWIPSAWGMEMTLSRHVPMKIKAHLKPFIAELFKKANLSPSQINSCQFAIHPGGPKIIDSVQEVLELKDQQTIQSRRILEHRGNMSSATLPHIWHEILQDPSMEKGKIVVSLAFGPGLTLFGSIFEVV